MHDLHILAEFLMIFGVAIVVVWLFHRIKLPSLVGFLAAGVLIGPGGLGLIGQRADIDLLAEIGVILLLFSIGLEFSLKDLIRIRKLVLGAGGLQLTLTAGLVYGVASAFGYPTGQAIFIGALAGLSSTAIVLSLLQKSGELSAVHGQAKLGILLLQDIAVVPLILLVPILAGEMPGGSQLAWTAAKVVLVVVGLWLAATYVFPWIIERVVKTQQSELFTLMTVVLALGTAYVSGLAGLSLALGAFLAGLLISESPYSHQILTEVLPFRDVFNSLFFISVGMLFRPSVFLDMPLELGGLILAVMVVKATIVALIIVGMGYGLRVGILTGLGLAQIGEFSFILAKEGMRFDMLSQQDYSIFMAVSVTTMALTPLLFTLAHRLSQRVGRAGPSRIERWLAPTEDVGDSAETHGHQAYEDHVIIVGYGINGRNAARVLSRIDVPYVVVEMNPETVRQHRDDEPIYFGDAARKPVLDHLNIADARALVVAIADAATTRRIVSHARRSSEDLSIIVRTRYVHEVDELRNLGADLVIPEEFETSLALVGAVLETYGVAPLAILREKDEIRRESYDLLRRPGESTPSEHSPTLEHLVHDVNVEVVRVPPSSPLIGETLGSTDIRAKFGVTVIGINRNQQMQTNPDLDWTFQDGDELILIGDRDQVEDARRYIES
ncbi:MAG: cation:proton antiporter [Myxococcota bacterium]